MTLLEAILPAVLLGIQTSISPCPLAGNIAAISFIGRGAGNPARVLLSGLCYALGRSLSYIAVAAVVMAALLSQSSASLFLQTKLSPFLGPMLIVAGMLLVGLLKWSKSISLAGPRLQAKVAGGGALWAAALGAVLALSFCPISAGLFFMGLLPLSAAHESKVLLPTVFGLGTALPVVAFAFLIAFAAGTVAKAFGVLARIDVWSRRVAGAVFIMAGIYYTFIYTFGVSW